MILLTDCKINNWSPSKLWTCRRLRHATGRHFRDLQQALTFVVRRKDLTIFRIFSWLKLFCWFDVRKKDFQRNELCCNSVSNKKPANFKSFLPNANVTLALSLVGGDYYFFRWKQFSYYFGRASASLLVLDYC